MKTSIKLPSTLHPVSFIEVYYKLDKNLDGNRIIQDIKRLLVGRENLSNSIVEIRIKSIAYTDTTMIPKIEYKPCVI